jgi:hypothetical protein
VTNEEYVMAQKLVPSSPAAKGTAAKFTAPELKQVNENLTATDELILTLVASYRRCAVESDALEGLLAVSDGLFWQEQNQVAWATLAGRLVQRLAAAEDLWEGHQCESHCELDHVEEGLDAACAGGGSGSPNAPRATPAHQMVDGVCAERGRVGGAS